jgi:drug/metabolite transporter (DMT)-like permease
MSGPVRDRLALFLVLGGALLLAAKGIFAKLLYADGVALEALLVTRAVVSLPFIWGWAVLRGELARLVAAPRRAIALAALGGFSGYYVGTWFDFRALQLIDASLERVLLFTYPAIVVILRAAMLGRWPARREAAAALVAWIGVVCAVGGPDASLWAANGRGAAFVLIAAATFAVYLLANERVGKTLGSVGFLVVASTAAAVSLCAHFAATSDFEALLLSPRAWGLLLVMTVFTNVLPLFMLSAGIGRIGAARAAILTSVGPPATLLMAWLGLGERFGAVQIAGAVLIVAGIAILEYGRAAVAGTRR